MMRECQHYSSNFRSAIYHTELPARKPNPSDPRRKNELSRGVIKATPATGH